MSVLGYDQQYEPSEEPHAENRPLAIVDGPTPAPKGRQFEYRSGSIEGGRLDSLLNEYGKEGWRLRFCSPTRTAAGGTGGSFVVILERELGPDSSGTPAL
jgi:hypothetical protein